MVDEDKCPCSHLSLACASQFPYYLKNNMMTAAIGHEPMRSWSMQILLETGGKEFICDFMKKGSVFRRDE